MNSIARFLIVPFLLVCLSVMGCAVFAPKSGENTVSTETGNSTAKIVLQEDRLSASSEARVDGRGRDIGELLADEKELIESSETVLPTQSAVVPSESKPSQSLVESPNIPVDGPIGNVGGSVLRAERINFVTDEPFGRRLRVASHVAVEPKTVRTPLRIQEPSADDIAAVMVSDTAVGIDNELFWTVENNSLLEKVLVRNKDVKLQFEPKEGKATSVGELQVLIQQSNGKFFDKEKVEVMAAPAEFQFNDKWNAGDSVSVLVMDKEVAKLEDVATADQEAIVVALVGKLTSSVVPEANLVDWKADQDKLVAEFKSPWNLDQNIRFRIDDDSQDADNAPKITPLSNGILPDLEKGLTEAGLDLESGKSNPIKIWVGHEITQALVKGAPLRSFEISVPRLNEPQPPVILGVQATKYLEFTNFDGEQNHELFGDQPYVRIEGRNGIPEQGELRMLIRDNTGKPVDASFELMAMRTVDTGQQKWQADLRLADKLSQDDGNNFYNLFVLLVRGDRHNYSAEPIKFKTTGKYNQTLPGQLTAAVDSAQGVNGVFLTNRTNIVLTGPDDVANESIHADLAVVASTNGGRTILGAVPGGVGSKWEIEVKDLKLGRHDIEIQLFAGENAVGPKTTVPVFIETKGPKVISVEPSNFGTAPGVASLIVTFDKKNSLGKATWQKFVSTNLTELKTIFTLYRSNGSGQFRGTETPVEALTGVTSNEPNNSVTLQFEPDSLPADVYQLRIDGSKILDVYGNKLVGDDGIQGSRYTKTLGAAGRASANLTPKFTPDDSPTINTGISGTTGEYVPFPEYVRRPDVPDGFNPNDKVETRVVRLYYYRDAHRIAQIVNRKVKSYNRAAVDTNRQLADKARNQANQLTVARQNAERNAIVLANQTRQQENELQQLENSLNGSIQQLTNYRREKPDADPATDPMIQQLQSLVTSFNNQVKDKRSAVQGARDEEVSANEQTKRAEAQEKLAREEQFRREVAAAHSDPDTYAPGKLNSVDPVEQVSVSVVGEGLIQLRGPLKGINLIRTAIDQLDTPVGQVRVALHTIQINGERADRMEVVAKEVQTHIDHARFLTMQTSEMLRKAVVQVASRKAEEASAMFPGSSQMERDERYIVAFFGKDFIDELRAMDSEFLHTGNKLLSLHSMDTTSLASALNLVALAKNSTRQEIFSEFDEMLQAELPQKEMNYFRAGWSCPKKKKSLFHRCKHCEPEFCPLACNAKFESLRGFFDMHIGHDDTMTPLQREFIRLAQIFKSRLITEMEYKQRVMERAIIEERLGNRDAELRAAIQKEKSANEELARMQKATVKSRVEMVKLAKEIDHALQTEIESEFAAAQARTGFFGFFGNAGAMLNNGTIRPDHKGELSLNNQKIRFSLSNRGTITTFDDPQQFGEVKKEYKAMLDNLTYLHSSLRLIASIVKNTQYDAKLEKLDEYLTECRAFPPQPIAGKANSWGTDRLAVFAQVDEFLQTLTDPVDGAKNTLLNDLSSLLENHLRLLVTNLGKKDGTSISLAYKNWIELKKVIRPLIQSIPKGIEKEEIESNVVAADKHFSELFGYAFLLEEAENEATSSRRPLDHKKFLDMLVDDLEEKYIELLDGTRAQIANIDNYLKRVTTALDDDFNTQFYYPAFKMIRESSVSYDVQFGQTESTTLLANNREFAKADPSATMEFDLPPRDTLLQEGIDGGLAMMNDVGALANNPAFLAMASLNGPGSTAAYNRGASGGNGVVRNVIPGLDGTTSEQVMSQNSNGGQQFGSNLENLIPDPAVYKFETGTGFEIRPVIQPDGQAVVFDFNYMYTTEIREPVRADEKHLGRVKRHYVDTDVQLSNFELREVSRYTVALKAARTAKGVPLLEDVPGVGVLFRPLPSDENSLQQNLIMAQATIFPTLFDLMGLRWAPVVSDLDPLRLSDSDFIVRNRRRMLENRVYDESSAYVDSFLRVPDAERRMDLYRSQDSIPHVHPNGYRGPGMNYQDSQMREGYQPNRHYPAQPFTPGQSIEGPTDPTYRGPKLDNYNDQRSSASPYPSPIREPFRVVNPRER